LSPDREEITFHANGFLGPRTCNDIIPCGLPVGKVSRGVSVLHTAQGMGFIHILAPFLFVESGLRGICPRLIFQHLKGEATDETADFTGWYGCCFGFGCGWLWWG